MQGALTKGRDARGRTFPIICALNCFEAAEDRRACSYLQHKSVPQRLKPSSADEITARLKPVPFVERGFFLQPLSRCTPNQQFVQNAL